MPQMILDRWQTEEGTGTAVRQRQLRTSSIEAQNARADDQPYRLRYLNTRHARWRALAAGMAYREISHCREKHQFIPIMDEHSTAQNIALVACGRLDLAREPHRQHHDKTNIRNDVA